MKMEVVPQPRVTELLGLMHQPRSFIYVLAEAEACHGLSDAFSVFDDTEILEGRPAAADERAAYELVEDMATGAYQALLRFPVLDLAELYRKAKFLAQVSNTHPEGPQAALEALVTNIRDLSGEGKK